MVEELKIGISGHQEDLVTKDKTAVTMGSGSLEVYATPSMIALMEGAAVNALENRLPAGTDSVGTGLEVLHLAATPLGMKVRATATLININGRKLAFEVEAFDEVDKIGSGIHQRYLIDGEKFMERCQGKKGEERGIK
jgi:predicted thioesterase